jgi:hypothetical protein
MRRIHAVSFVLAAVMLAGCGSDKATNPLDQSPTTLSGTFALQSVNQKTLPYSFTDPEAGSGVVFSLISDRITFQADGKFSEVTLVSVTQGGQTTGPATLPSSGTFVYTSSTRAVSLLAIGGARITGTLVNDTMTLKDDSDTFVFKREQ